MRVNRFTITLLSVMALAPFYCYRDGLVTGLPLAQYMPQTQSDNDRGTVKALDFISSRPGGSGPQPGRYRSRQTAPVGRAFVALGVTIGRGRRPTEVESKNTNVAKVYVGDREEHILERVSDATVMTDGTLLQMIIEYLPHSDTGGKRLAHQIGYVYVINREEYADGKYSAPRLIFPTKRTYGGDSRVLPGKTVTLPVPERVWRISRSASGTAQAFENYIIIVSPTPLKDSLGRELQRDNLEAGSLRLPDKLVDTWIRLWGGDEWRGDLEHGEGQLLTRREQYASGDPGRSERSTDEESTDLTKDDAPPQMVYRKVLRSGGTMLITVKLPFRDG